jgi:hypothetical protein
LHGKVDGLSTGYCLEFAMVIVATFADPFGGF